ncbi:MAG TPA: DUF4395 domain-containing protein [Anaeromyxobacteraceae bacterium]|nr:DUF4395 domain-containing protein [Anaeromyxobacteraceae bacterium]
MALPTADPYRDLQVIDARAPRFNQAVIGLLAALALATGFWPILALPALQLTLTLAFGRRWCLACRFYFAFVQPRFGEGPLEDSRPPRFANQLGSVCLWVATVAHALGAHRIGDGLAILVAALALLAAVTGFCTGCAAYRVAARLRGVRGRTFERVDLEELGAAPGREAVIQFTHPLCSDCQTLRRRLEAEGREPVLVDVSKRPDLARKYGVAVVPLAVAVGADGRVAHRIG